MTKDEEQFEAWWLTKFSAEFLDSDNCHSAWTGWQARGELDAVRIAELEARNKELEALAEQPTQKPVLIQWYDEEEDVWENTDERYYQHYADTGHKIRFLYTTPQGEE
jgi:hypothetical protein